MNDSITVPELQSMLARKNEIVLVDVRRKNDATADPLMLPGAVWHDPEDAASWSRQLPYGKEAVIYCVRGGSVSKSTVETLRAAGVKASYVVGGLAAWKDSGGELVPWNTVGGNEKE